MNRGVAFSFLFLLVEVFSQNTPLDDQIIKFQNIITANKGEKSEIFGLVGLGMSLHAKYRQETTTYSYKIGQEALQSFHNAMTLGIDADILRNALQEDRLHMMFLILKEELSLSIESERAYNDTIAHSTMNTKDIIFSLVYEAFSLQSRGNFRNAIDKLYESIPIYPNDNFFLLNTIYQFCRLKQDQLSHDDWLKLYTVMEAQFIQTNADVTTNPDGEIMPHDASQQTTDKYKRLLHSYSLLAKSAYFSEDFDKAWEFTEKMNILSKSVSPAVSVVQQIDIEEKELNGNMQYFKKLIDRLSGFIRGARSSYQREGVVPVFLVGFSPADTLLLAKIMAAFPSVHVLRHGSVVKGRIAGFKQLVSSSISTGKVGLQELFEISMDYGNKVLIDMVDIAIEERSLMQNDKDISSSPEEDMEEVSESYYYTEDGDAENEVESQEEIELTHVVDSAFTHFLNVGIIFQMFPNAIVINMVRDPMDSLLSVLLCEDDNDVELEEFYLSQLMVLSKFRNYLIGTKFYRDSIPGVFLDVKYEELCVAPEAAVLTVAESIGLMVDVDDIMKYINGINFSRFSDRLGSWVHFGNNLDDLRSRWREEQQKLRQNDALAYVGSINWDADTQYNYKAQDEKEHAAILIPITSKGLPANTALAELPLLKIFTSSFRATQAGVLEHFKVLIALGYDVGDPIYDNAANRDFILTEMARELPQVKIQAIAMPDFKGKVFHVWNRLAAHAYRDGAEYYFFLGDDLLLKSKNWMGSIVERLQNNQFLSNLGTVAFFDEHKREKHGTRPTVPSFHRSHLDIFGADFAIDPVFGNQFGDPWIFDVYLPFNSSVIEERAHLYNVIGGDVMPRYSPEQPSWELYIDAVQRGRRRVAKWIASRRIQDYTWTPAELAYGAEGMHFIDYCRESPGCMSQAISTPS